MPTGDFLCEDCGSYYCGISPAGPVECGAKMSMRPKSDLKREPLPDPFDSSTLVDRLNGSSVDENRLLAYLTGYLGDEVFAKRFADCLTLIRAKNADYTQGTAKRDRIAAFRRISGDIGVPMEKVWAIFCQKHWGAVMRYVKDGEVESEPIDGRINDIINYMVLLGAIIDDGRSDG